MDITWFFRGSITKRYQKDITKLILHSKILVLRNHLTYDLIAVENQQLTGQQQWTTQINFYTLKSVMQLAIMDLFSSISGFFVGQRHQLVQSLPAFFANALISTSTASTRLVHRNLPTSELFAVQEQHLIGQRQCTTQIYFYALKSIMQPTITDLFFFSFVGQRHTLVQSLPSYFVFVLISTSSRWAFIPSPSA